MFVLQHMSESERTKASLKVGENINKKPCGESSSVGVYYRYRWAWSPMIALDKEGYMCYINVHAFSLCVLAYWVCVLPLVGLGMDACPQCWAVHFNFFLFKWHPSLKFTYATRQADRYGTSKEINSSPERMYLERQSKPGKSHQEGAKPGKSCWEVQSTRLTPKDVTPQSEGWNHPWMWMCVCICVCVPVEVALLLLLLYNHIMQPNLSSEFKPSSAVQWAAMWEAPGPLRFFTALFLWVPNEHVFVQTS